MDDQNEDPQKYPSNWTEMLDIAFKASRKLTVEQIREYNDAFVMFDKGGRGFLTSSDLREVMRSLGFNATDLQLETLYLRIDHDGNGKIDFHEFVYLLDTFRSPEKEEESFLESFRAFDIDDKGYIPTADLKEAMAYILEKSSEKEIENVMRMFQLNENRNVDYEEFKQMIDPPERDLDLPTERATNGVTKKRFRKKSMANPP